MLLPKNFNINENEDQYYPDKCPDKYYLMMMHFYYQKYQFSMAIYHLQFTLLYKSYNSVGKFMRKFWEYFRFSTF